MPSVQSALEVLKLVWPEFEARDDLVFLPGACPKDISALRDHVARFDRTAAEAFYNHTHVLDLFDHDTRKDGEEDDIWWQEDHPDFRAACECGKLMARMLVCRLREAFPQRRFVVIYTEKDDPIVRFHQYHEDEPSWLSVENCAAEIERGEILVLDTTADPLA